jgi:hypothetical protein
MAWYQTMQFNLVRQGAQLAKADNFLAHERNRTLGVDGYHIGRCR